MEYMLKVGLSLNIHHCSKVYTKYVWNEHIHNPIYFAAAINFGESAGLIAGIEVKISALA